MKSKQQKKKKKKPKKKKKKKKMQYTISKHFTKHKILLLKFLIIFLHSHLILDIKRLMENDSKF